MGTVESQRMQRLGPQVYDWLNQPVSGGNGNQLASTALTNIFRYDQQNPNYMRDNGQEVMNLIKQNYGEGALNSFMNPTTLGMGVFHSAGNVLGGSNSDTERARSAVRNYLGYKAPRSLAQQGLGFLVGQPQQ
jgi:hypothetical protein